MVVLFLLRIVDIISLVSVVTVSDLSSKYSTWGSPYTSPVSSYEKSVIWFSIHVFALDKNTFVYLDPPYRPISATSSFTSYNTEAFDDSEQFRLAEFADELNARGVKFALSNSDPKNTDNDDNFFDELYKDYTIERIGVSRMINSKAEKRGKIKELIIYN